MRWIRFPGGPRRSGLAAPGHSRFQLPIGSYRVLEREAAALNVYVLSLARFLGPQQNGDQAGMSCRAKFMLTFIDMVLDAAYAAARSRSLGDQLILNELEERQLGANKAGGWSWSRQGWDALQRPICRPRCAMS